jgi:hypothetical protein
MGQTVNLLASVFGGSNPSPSTIVSHIYLKCEWWAVEVDDLSKRLHSFLYLFKMQDLNLICENLFSHSWLDSRKSRKDNCSGSEKPDPRGICMGCSFIGI